jgi:hypothetical protein
MQLRTVESLIVSLTRHAWRIERSAGAEQLTPELSNFPAASMWAGVVRSCESPDGSVWFLGSDDYADQSGERWNFLEQGISKPSAEGDDKWLAEIDRFWRRHMPIALSTRGDYGYVAVTADGKIVLGYAPELENPDVVAESFEAFVELIDDELKAAKGKLYLFLAG